MTTHGYEVMRRNIIQDEQQRLVARAAWLVNHSENLSEYASVPSEREYAETKDSLATRLQNAHRAAFGTEQRQAENVIETNSGMRTLREATRNNWAPVDEEWRRVYAARAGS
jgi:hypothetical protein